jgi:hypothetical protein
MQNEDNANNEACGVFVNDHHFPSLEEALDHHDVDDSLVVREARPVGGLPSAREIVDDWADNAGCDVDGWGPDVTTVPDEAIEALDAALAAFNPHLPGWYEQGDIITDREDVAEVLAAWRAEWEGDDA